MHSPIARALSFSSRNEHPLTATARNTGRPWSGWAGAAQNRFSALDAEKLGERAVEKSGFQGRSCRSGAGRLHCHLEGAAVADLTLQLLIYIDISGENEGRSFLSKPGGGTKLNEKLLNEHVTITSDPTDPIVPETPFGEKMAWPKSRTVWFKARHRKTCELLALLGAKDRPGSVATFPKTSQWREAVPFEDMIRDIDGGILVTRFWYVNIVDPRTLLSTGMTRDGNFLVENGKIVAPALDLRFNCESPVCAFSNIEAVGSAKHAISGYGGDYAISVPPLIIKGFTFFALEVERHLRKRCLQRAANSGKTSQRAGLSARHRASRRDINTFAGWRPSGESGDSLDGHSSRVLLLVIPAVRGFQLLHP